MHLHADKKTKHYRGPVPVMESHDWPSHRDHALLHGARALEVQPKLVFRAVQ